MAGRELALASSFVLCSSAFFVGEMRQAGNDGPLAFFTTLALYAAWRRLDDARGAEQPTDHAAAPERGSRTPGALRLSLVFYGALGLGFLTKGPVIVLLVGMTLIPYLAIIRRLSWGLRQLACGWGVLIFAALASAWPVAVLLEDGAAARVWALEMTEKTGLSQILEHRRHPALAGQWPGMVLPWTLIALRGDRAAVLAEQKSPHSPRRWRGGNARIRVPLVPVVVERRKPCSFLLLGGHEAQLLRAMSAGHGLADRRRVARARAGGARRARLSGVHRRSRPLAGTVGLAVRGGGGCPARPARLAA